MSLVELLSNIKQTAEALENIPSSHAGCVRQRQALLSIKKECDKLRKGLMEHSKALKQSRRPDPEAKREAKPEAKSESETEPKSESETETKSESETTKEEDYNLMPLEPPKLERSNATHPNVVKLKRPRKVKAETV